MSLGFLLACRLIANCRMMLGHEFRDFHSTVTKDLEDLEDSSRGLEHVPAALRCYAMQAAAAMGSDASARSCRTVIVVAIDHFISDARLHTLGS